MELPRNVRIPIVDKRGAWVPASRWWRNGDHPLDGVAKSDPLTYEGRLVRRFRRPDVDGGTACPTCGRLYFDHGWIDKGGVTVCPGFYVVNHPDGTFSMVTAAQVAAAFRDDTEQEKRGGNR